MEGQTKALYGMASCNVGKAMFSLKKWFCVVVILLVSCPIFGQVPAKQPVTAKDYHLWGTMYIDKLSASGKWVSYGMRYDDEPSTLFLKNTDSKKQFRFPGAGNGEFCGDGYFACIDQSKSLSVVALRSGKVSKIDNVHSYSFTTNGKYLITLDDAKVLSIRKPDGTFEESIIGIREYKMSPEGNALLCAGSNHGSNRVLRIDFRKGVVISEIAEAADGGFSHLVWHSGDESCAFLKDGSVRTVGFYSFRESRFTELLPDEFDGFSKDSTIPAGYGSGLSVSDDGRRVFFSVRKNESASKKFDGLQIWYGDDARIFPEQAYTGDAEFNTVMMAWWPEEHKILQLTGATRPFCMLNATQDFAVTYNNTDLGPQYIQSPDVNYYVTNLETGANEVLATKQSTTLYDTGFSPGGKYFAYQKETQWCVYDFKSKHHLPINLGQHNALSTAKDNGNTEKYSIAGWGLNDEFLLFYDAFDLWKVAMDGKAPVRLTDGRKNQTVYRIVKPEKSPFYQSSFRGHVDLPYNLNNGFILSGSNASKTGYFILKGDGRLREIVFDGMQNTAIITNDGGAQFAYLSENFNRPPELFVTTTKGKPKLITQSNEQHSNYAWGMQETISYKNSMGKRLSGLLYYPANFDPDKKYPMVVHIYEEQYYRKKQYINPSFSNMTGFNVANLTADGYFVMLPDIDYRIGNPGLSATDCVTSAVRKALEHLYIDSGRVGLVGHSFGGYETNFIITQSDLFACAVSGASVADFPGWYLSVGWNDGKPEPWRFESQQFRMGKSLFEDYEGYLRNSPIRHASDIKTPILLWAGEDDRQVHYDQSIAFYLALRRLSKKEVLLIYPGEGHAMIKQENRKDLTVKLSEWLGYFLKGEAPAEWMLEGVR